MRKINWLIYLVLTILALPLQAQNKAIWLDINGAIGPATEDFIARGIQKGIKDKANCVIIQLNTPGGLETAMRGINEAIIASPIPVVTYVAPQGARAASAGTFIAYASHIAVMAPGTNIGAAAPVALTASGTGDEQAKQNKSMQKAVNDAAAYIRSLAQLRGRNVEWAEKAVRQAESLSAVEAKKLGVIDEVIQDNEQLFTYLASQKIDTDNIEVVRIPLDWRYQFLSFITDPNIAYILMLVALYGIFFELSNPGLILPGVAGVISLFLVLYAFQLMPINYVGLTLIIVGLLFLGLELFVPSFGALGIGGLISFVIGSIMLYDTPWVVDFQLALPLIITITITTALFFFVVLRLAIKSYRKPVVSGRQGLIGQQGVVTHVNDDNIRVQVAGEIWNARCAQTVRVNQKIQITDIKGLQLIIEPIKESS